MTKAICFDLDDTLIDDNFKFEITFCDCIRTIITALETQSPQIDSILQLARDLDNEKWRTWPPEERYLPRRVATAWMETYVKIANEKHIPVKAHIKRLIWAQVMTNYDPPYFVIPGVIETLLKLKERGYQLHVVTVGLYNIQMRKLKLTELLKYFDRAHVVTYDKQAVLEEIAKEYGKEEVIMVGNSMRSDINPALSLGVSAIYIPRGNWHNFKADPVNNNYKTVGKIEDILQLL